VASKATKSKFCFIISHIGKAGTPERIDANRKLTHLFSPVLRDLKFEFKRSDDESTPGFISTQIIKRLIDSDMVISDISLENANVFYELAVRHAIKKPVIIIKKPNQKPPFDITDIRAIDVDMSDPDIWQPAKKKLSEYINEAESDPQKASESILSNFTSAFNLQSREDKESEVLLRMKDLQSQNRRLEKTLEQIKQNQSPPALSSLPFELTTAPTFNIGGDLVTVSCKNCQRLFSIPRSSEILGASSPDEIIGTCPSCDKTDSYSASDFMT